MDSRVTKIDLDEFAVEQRARWTLELRAFRAEVRLLVFGAVAANQALVHINAGGILSSVVAGAALVRWLSTSRKAL